MHTREGIDIMDDDGEVRGRSVAAGRQSLTQVALTRVALPVPSAFPFLLSMVENEWKPDRLTGYVHRVCIVLLLPPYLYEGLKKAKLMPKARYPRLATELSTSTNSSSLMYAVHRMPN